MEKSLTREWKQEDVTLSNFKAQLGPLPHGVILPNVPLFVTMGRDVIGSAVISVHPDMRMWADVTLDKHSVERLDAELGTLKVTLVMPTQLHTANFDPMAPRYFIRPTHLELSAMGEYALLPVVADKSEE